MTDGYARSPPSKPAFSEQDARIDLNQIVAIIGLSSQRFTPNELRIFETKNFLRIFWQSRLLSNLCIPVAVYVANAMGTPLKYPIQGVGGRSSASLGCWLRRAGEERGGHDAHGVGNNPLAQLV